MRITPEKAKDLLMALGNVLEDQDFILEGLLNTGEEVHPECLEANQILHDFEGELTELIMTAN